MFDGKVHRYDQFYRYILNLFLFRYILESNYMGRT